MESALGGASIRERFRKDLTQVEPRDPSVKHDLTVKLAWHGNDYLNAMENCSTKVHSFDFVDNPRRKKS